MCANRKQKIIASRPALGASRRGGFGKTVIAASAAMLSLSPVFAQSTTASHSGGVALGATEGGIASEAFVLAPPNYAYVAATTAGSFVDCGDAMTSRRTDKDGRDATPLTCGVTLTETVVIPAASASARLIIHY